MSERARRAREGHRLKAQKNDYGFGTVRTWLQKLISDSAVSPVTAYSHGRYATVVREVRSVLVQEYKVVRGFVPCQQERCFQHFRVRVHGDDAPLCIINCHAPSGRKRRLTRNGRTMDLRAFQRRRSPCLGFDFNKENIQGSISGAIQLINTRVQFASTTSASLSSGGIQIQRKHCVAQPVLNELYSL